MATVNDVFAAIDGFAPFGATLPGFTDNVGLLVGRGDAVVTKAVCCLDATLAVIDEAAKEGAQLIISHHPIVFRSIDRVTDGSDVGRRVLAAAENGIAVISAHTNLDVAAGGINDYAAALLGIEDATALGEGGYGRIGELAAATTLGEFTVLARDAFGDGRAAFIGDGGAPVKRVAVVNGSGGDTATMDLARSLGADVLVTGEVRHHAAVYAAELGLCVVEISHYSAEHAFVGELAKRLGEIAQKCGMGVGFFVSRAEKDPFAQA